MKHISLPQMNQTKPSAPHSQSMRESRGNRKRIIYMKEENQVSIVQDSSLFSLLSKSKQYHMILTD